MLVSRSENKQQAVQQKTVANTQAKTGIAIPSISLFQKKENPAGESLQRKVSLPKNPAWSVTPVAQLQHVIPQTYGANLTFDRMAAIDDDQAPARISKYTYDYVAGAGAPALTSRAEALDASARAYAQAGASMQAGPPFISKNNLRGWATGNVANAPAVYDVFKERNRVPAEVPAGAGNENQRKMAHYNDPARVVWFDDRNVLSWFQDNATINLKDPLFVEINTPWQSAAMAAPANLRTIISFTEAFRGYIYKVEDTNLNVNATMTRRAPHTAATGGATTAATSFSSTHHSDGDATVDTEIALSGAPNTHHQQEQGIDAMTKVIAEGGRFACVRTYGTNITNETKFYARHPEERGSVVYIEFKTLWRLWKNEFNSDYNIPDNRVRAVVRRLWLQGKAEAMSEDAVGATDYNLG